MASVAIPTGAMEEILSNPADDAPRMMLADYLEERDDPRGEFIRVQCRIAELCAWHRAGNPTHPDFDWLLQREGELHQIGQVPHYEWLSSLGIDPSDCVFNRGFVASITCTAADFLKHADSIYWHPEQKRPRPDDAQPIESVEFTAWPKDTVYREDDFMAAYLQIDDRFILLLRTKRVDQTWQQMRPRVIGSFFANRWPRIQFKFPVAGVGLSIADALADAVRNLATAPVSVEPWTPLSRLRERYMTGIPLIRQPGILISSITP